MSLESSKSFFEYGSIILLFLTFVFGTGALLTANSINKAQEGRLKVFEAQLTEAQTGLAKQQERAALAETALEELKRHAAPREVKRAEFKSALALLKDGPQPAGVEIVYLRDDPDSFNVAQQIYQLLKESGWNASSPVPIPPATASTFSQSPTAMAAGGQPSGVSVGTHTISEAESSAKLTFPGTDWVKTPWTVLSYAVLQSLGQCGGFAGGQNAPPEGILRVVVAPRM